MKPAPTIDELTLAEEGQDIHTFSNGTEWDCWSGHNCDLCRWYDQTKIYEGCGFVLAAFAGLVTPATALLFGWTRNEEGAARWCKEHNEADDPRDWWHYPETCAFFSDKRDDDEDRQAPPPPFVDPAQLSFLAPDGFPAEVPEYAHA